MVHHGFLLLATASGNPVMVQPAARTPAIGSERMVLVVAAHGSSLIWGEYNRVAAEFRFTAGVSTNSRVAGGISGNAVNYCHDPDRHAGTVKDHDPLTVSTSVLLATFIDQCSGGNGGQSGRDLVVPETRLGG